MTLVEPFRVTVSASIISGAGIIDLQVTQSEIDRNSDHVVMLGKKLADALRELGVRVDGSQESRTVRP